MVNFHPLFEKKYGRYLIKENLLTVIFITVFLITIVILNPYLDSKNDTILSKIGTMTSITGVFLGTYIALWLIVQNRSKKIEENFFYKISFLTNVQGMLHPIYQISFKIKIESERKTNDIESIQNIRQPLKEEFEYWKTQLEKINSNTSVPADIRTGVDMLIHQGIKPITFVNMDIRLHHDMVKTTLLDPLNRLICSSYFVKDNDTQVQHYLNQVIEWRNKINESITEQTDPNSD